MFFKKFSKPKDVAVDQSCQTKQTFIRTENPMPESGFVFVEGGKDCKEYKFSGSDSVDEVAWYGENAQGRLNHIDDEISEDEYEDFDEDENDDDDDGYGTQPVKTKKPNTLGIYDMSGNVFEWCWDWFGVYEEEPQVNPTVETDPVSMRIGRGGSWLRDEDHCVVTKRDWHVPYEGCYDLGFRVVRSIR